MPGALGVKVKAAWVGADEMTVNMTTALPVVATLLAAVLGALGSAGWTSDSRLLRRAERALDLAAKTPERRLRVRLREEAGKDIGRALELRRTRRPLATVGTTAAGAAVVALLLIPWWLTHHPEQEAGWLGIVWVSLWLAYIVGSVVGVVLFILMLRARSPRT